MGRHSGFFTHVDQMLHLPSLLLTYNCPRLLQHVTVLVMDALVPAPITAFIAKPATLWMIQTHVQVGTISMSPISVLLTMQFGSARFSQMVS